MKINLVINQNINKIEKQAIEQIEKMKEAGLFQGLISIMPDCHLGVGSVIGFTGKFKDGIVIPNVVGVDIGCGVSTYNLGKIDLNLEKIYKFIKKNINMGQSQYDSWNHLYFNDDIYEKSKKISEKVIDFYELYDIKKFTDPMKQLGSLGGGNHFIELDKDKNDNIYLTIHTGSRNFGFKVANYFQKVAKDINKKISNNYFKDLEPLPISEYLGKNSGKEYIKHLRIAQQYSKLNREIITKIILNYLNIEFKKENYIECIHNYISEKDNIIRKGAISAYKNEEIIIPISMSDGIIVGKGLANNRYNYSAPHGAGRVLGRKEAKRKLESGELTMDEFELKMKGIYTELRKNIIDESPMVYKNKEDIIDYLTDTVKIEKIIKPIMNIKA